MNKNYVIGVDYGSDSVRALIVDASTGEEIAWGVSNYSRWNKGLYCDATSNRYRQHPLDYIESLETALHESLSRTSRKVIDNIRGICFDTTGSTPVLTDASGTPLALLPQFSENPDAMFVLWKDHTAVAEAELINSLMAENDINYTAYEGGTYSSEWVWAKVAHIISTNSEIREAAYSWMEHCDWITALMTGSTTPETILRSRCAAGHKAMWHQSWGLPSHEFLTCLHPSLAAMRDHLFSQTHTSDTPAGTMTPQWASRLGLPKDIVVAVGALDAHMGAVGACAKPYVLTRIIGTSTCDIMVAPKEMSAEHCIDGICGQVDGSVVPGYIGIEAGQSAFGDIYAWFKEIVAWPLRTLMPAGGQVNAAIDAILPTLMSEAETIAPGQSDIVALDWFNGRRTPHADQNRKGTIWGLTLGSSAPMVLRALVESTAFGSKAIINHLQSQGIEIKSINAIGGISHKSPLVMQILADVLNMPIRVVRSEQACALGSAMFAAVVAGIYPTVEQAQETMGSGFIAEYTPDPASHKIYSALYQEYQRLAEAESKRG